MSQWQLEAVAVTEARLVVSYSSRNGDKYKFNSFLQGRIGMSQRLTKFKEFEGAGGVRNSTEVSALGNSIWVKTCTSLK